MLVHAMQEGRTHKVWPIAQVAELHHARYLLQPRALELFLYSRSSALLSFETPKVSCWPSQFICIHLSYMHAELIFCAGASAQQRM